MIDLLLKVFASYKMFEWGVHNIHRQGKGETDGYIHKKSEEYYEYAQGTMDDTAERIMQLKGEIPLKLCDVIALSEVPGIASIGDTHDQLQTMITLHCKIADILKVGIKKAADIFDYHTEDLFRGWCAYHEKQAWLLGKNLSSES